MRSMKTAKGNKIKKNKHLDKESWSLCINVQILLGNRKYKEQCWGIYCTIMELWLYLLPSVAVSPDSMQARVMPAGPLWVSVKDFLQGAFGVG